MRPFYKFQMSADASKPAVLSIYDEIGGWAGVQAADFRDQLGAVKSSAIDLEINSPGGDVFAGIAIYNMLKASGKTINTKVMGVAASAASLIAMAGDTIEMPKNTFMMVHNPWSFAMGNADDLREQADLLDKIGDSITGTYVDKTGQSLEDMKAMLSKDTWLTADEALSKGFATKVTDAIEANAAFDMERAELPENVRAVYQKAKPSPEQVPNTPVAQKIAAAAKAKGLDTLAGYFALSFDTVEAAEARMAEAAEIVALHTFMKSPERAEAAIRASKTVADVRKDLLAEMAEADVQTNQARKDSKDSKKSSTPTGASPGVTTARLWEKHRNATQRKKD